MAKPRKDCPDCTASLELIQILAGLGGFLGKRTVQDDILAFWTGGQDEALRALREEYAAKIASLESQILRAAPAERERLFAAIKSTRKELAQKEKDLRWGLFGTTDAHSSRRQWHRWSAVFRVLSGRQAADGGHGS